MEMMGSLGLCIVDMLEIHISREYELDPIPRYYDRFPI